MDQPPIYEFDNEVAPARCPGCRRFLRFGVDLMFTIGGEDHCATCANAHETALRQAERAEFERNLRGEE